MAAQRCREVFDPPECVTLWNLPESIEEEFDARWEYWLDHATDRVPFFQKLETVASLDPVTVMQTFELVGDPHDPLRRVTSLLGYEVISIRIAARFARVSVAHMHRAAKGELPNTARLKVFRVGRRVLTRTDWLDEWMRAEPDRPPLTGGPQAVVA